MRHGFTTGSCAAAAAKAAAYMLLTGKDKETVTIITPRGISYSAKICEVIKTIDFVSCAVRKDGGDDPDITNGTLIFAKVSKKGDGKGHITIDGGEGVGRVTKPGLDQPVGYAAINHVPREMIEQEVKEVCRLVDYHKDLSVLISVPEGKTLAEKTFNPRLGIEGGISILGTSGIVEPMSSQALLDTIKVELKQKRAMKNSIAAVSPGNYGLDFMKKTYGYDLDTSVKCSNFIGDTIDMAADLGFDKMLLTGHIGKLVKVAGGIMNTHSKEADARMELIAAAAILNKVPYQAVEKILDCVVTEEAIQILDEVHKRNEVMETLIDKIMFYLNKRAAGRMKIEVIMYSNDFGELSKSKGADNYLLILKKENKKWYIL